MPSKRKKQKTASTTSRPLTQAEIWDDSALIRSWNDALAEYEYYHGIHARGEDVEEILRKAEAGELDDDGEDQPTTTATSAAWKPSQFEGGASATVDAIGVNGHVEGNEADAVTRAEDGEDAEEGEVVEQDEDGADVDAAHARPVPSAAHLDDSPTVSATGTAPLIGPGLPPGNADPGLNLDPAPVDNAPKEKGPPRSTSQDQTLENMKMAYYWAGYYSGLYDGQRQAQSQTQ
ncbi:hypothetical protein A1O7_06350 [Cladophialophora yegresii CBS 114405]|uniref:Survival Motor Neuron Gemin2-binding domain-containing protein n=1 Tax=Cladophialophora yegresii CBS 114405 TaxID=1182544 RepID=W9W1R2_9EURO|nr:uncharacterized protein A1O7_06350 [Cladophialophora yegresii CBS 114405]EXJ58920.1 hypothetical protein A1O7_06350 [Cladophialophora yegresii CBS 114405]